ncbi:MAG: phosphoserine phosphatase SerB [Pseudomonadota bacterium]
MTDSPPPEAAPDRWVAVCVSPVSPSHASKVLRDALQAAGATNGAGMSLRELGGHAEEFAAEVELPPSAPPVDVMRDALREAAGTGADMALVPAANRRKRLLICDMDSTIIAQECLDELADFAGLKAQVSAITERAMRGELDFEAALTTRVAMLEGLSLDALDACYTARIRLNPGAATLVATMKAKGAHTWLVSGGFTFFTERVASTAGFETHRGNTLLDDGERLTGAVGQPILGREAKLDALKSATGEAGLIPADALALGDGANDLAMICAAGLGIAYRAKPIVAADADAAINVCSLTAALFYQGIPAEEFVTA